MLRPMSHAGSLYIGLCLDESSLAVAGWLDRNCHRSGNRLPESPLPVLDETAEQLDVESYAALLREFAVCLEHSKSIERLIHPVSSGP